METSNEKKELLAEVKEFEQRIMAQAMLAAKDRKHIISSLHKVLSGGGLEVEVKLKEINGIPRFMTLTFLKPKVASFIFISYDNQGKLFLNRKIFNRMYEFLRSNSFVSDFRDLMRSEKFDKQPLSI